MSAAERFRNLDYRFDNDWTFVNTPRVVHGICTRCGTRIEVARLEGHGGRVTALALLLAGRLASGSDDRAIRLWDLATGAEVARLESHGGGVTALALLLAGRLASGSGYHDKTIRLWDLASGAEVAQLECHGSLVMALASLPTAASPRALWARSACGT